MDRSRRQGAPRVVEVGRTAAPATTPPPASSRLTVKARPNRRRQGSLWSRLPKPALIADSCGRALRRSLPALAGLAVLGAVGGTAWAGYRFVTTSPRFAIDEIAVHGNHRLTADQVRAALPVHVGDNVFATNLEAIARGLRGNPWVADVEVRRILPHALVVDVREHEPVAIADLGGLYLVDAAGFPFKRAAIDADDGAGLPIITGLDRASYLADRAGTATLVTHALAALAAWRSEGQRPAIGEVHVDPHGALTLHTYDQATSIQLGALDAGLAARMQTFDAAWSELTDAERARTRAIHLDSRPDHVIVAFSQKDL